MKQPRVFLRSHAGVYIDLFDQVLDRERRGDPLACQVLDALDAAFNATGEPSADLIVTECVRVGFFDHDMRHPLSWAGNCEHK
jgi:hypothetical protein